MSIKAHLQTLCGHTAKRSPLAVMNSVHITEAFGYATDGISSMKIEWDGPAGVDVCVDAGLLAAAVGGMADDQHIKFSPEKDAVRLSAGRRAIKLRALEPRGIQTILVDGTPVVVAAEALDQALSFAVMGTSTKSTIKPEYNNVLIEFAADGVWAVGVDGYKAHIAKVCDAIPGVEMKCFIPRPLAAKVSALCKFGGSVGLTKDRITVMKGDATFLGVLAQVAYPRWQMVLRDAAAFPARLSTGSVVLCQVAQSAAKLGLQYLTIEASGSLLSLSGVEKGDEFSHPIDVDYSGPQCSISVRPRYLMDACAHLGEMTEVLFGATPLPLVLRSGAFTAVIQGAKV